MKKLLSIALLCGCVELSHYAATASALGESMQNVSCTDGVCSLKKLSVELDEEQKLLDMNKEFDLSDDIRPVRKGNRYKLQRPYDVVEKNKLQRPYDAVEKITLEEKIAIPLHQDGWASKDAAADRYSIPEHPSKKSQIK